VNEPSPTPEHPSLAELPEWPGRTIGVLATSGPDPHAIPVSAPLRAGPRLVLISLHRTRGSLARLRERPQVALAILAAGDVAFTARGRARVVEDPMAAAPDYAAVAIDVEDVDDHRQPDFVVEAGIDRRWVDDEGRQAMGERVGALRELAGAEDAPPSSG
jgi:hypothetical protein